MSIYEWGVLVAAGLGDLLQLVDNQSYLGQQVLNVYYYRVVAITGLTSNYLEVLNNHWEEGVLSKILKVQVDDLKHVSREWRNMSNNTDLYTNTTVVEGDVTASAAMLTPSFVSLGFLLRRESLATRNGYKRIAGLPDDAIDGNAWTGTNSDIVAIENALAADLSEGLTTLVEPVIVKRPIVAPVGSYVYSSIGAAEFRGIGTQNSRKAGRGV